MKVWELSGFGLDSLHMRQGNAPEPGDSEVLIQVRAVSLNARDRLLADGVYNPALKFPMVQGSDAVGRVINVGKKVTRVQPGDRILTNFATRWLDGPPRLEESSYSLGSFLPGVLAEQIVIDEQVAVQTPEYLTDVEAATLPCAATTAWYALAETAKVVPGQTVVVQGTGGVSIFALQIAKALGCEVIVTSSSDDKIERAKRLGAAHGINYVRRPDWESSVLEITGGEGAHVVVETAGGENVEHSLRAAAIGGQIVMIGFLSGVSASFPLFPFVVKQLTFAGISVGSRATFERMLSAFERWQLRPVIDAVYDFTDTQAAYRHLYRGAFGKIVVQLPS